MRKNLSQGYAFAGKVYGPGDTDLPDNILEQDGLSPAFKEEIEGKSPVESAPLDTPAAKPSK